MPILFCNIGWMARYDGIDGDSIQRGGSYNKSEIGHEVCNFSNVDSKVYGYVQPTGRLNIVKLGAGKNDDCINNITVIWTAGPNSGGTAIVGWYKNATVYRDAQLLNAPSELQIQNGISMYRILADASDAVLLPVHKRNFMIPRAVKGGIGQSNVWYADKPESAVLVKEALALVNSEQYGTSLPDLDDVNGAYEGNPRFVSHLKRERNQKIVEQKKQDTLNKLGILRCEVCDFDFEKVYGMHGMGFCEVHHLLPLHKADGIVKTELDDLAIICSNCHRIIHRIDPMPSINELSKIVTETAQISV
ncbi:HNH endonuclease [Shewanella sp. SP1S2-4]|uniref:HNH endonuclease n=1 Tax=Shewanella sp. SP1S2-4 TaxID=3063537 RepID=UPI0028923E54|nr:HNH endonuclease [Shewanella sp. SP1S2-4]MDT3322022.1 HNH endonuclease [Shewanella sp. SP1S2-4]